MVGTAGAQVTREAANLAIPGYYDKLKGIVDHQVIGYRTIVEWKVWDPARPDDARSFDDRRVAVHGKNLWVSRVSYPPSRMPAGGDGKDYYVHILSPDVCYFPGGNRPAASTR